MTDDLVKRLRWSADGWDDCENPENAQQDREAADRIEELKALIELLHPPRRWDMGALVKKKSGAKWHGCVVGFYSTDLTPIGYCVASAFEENSVQIYPENALEDWNV